MIDSVRQRLARGMFMIQISSMILRFLRHAKLPGAPRAPNVTHFRRRPPRCSYISSLVNIFPRYASQASPQFSLLLSSKQFINSLSCELQKE